MLTPRPIQLQAAGMIQSHPTYLMCDMGTGKTLMTLLAFKRARENTSRLQLVVFAPLNPLLYTWPAEIIKWTPQFTYILLHGYNKDVKATQAHNYDILLINYEGVEWWHNQIKNRKLKVTGKFMVAMDESSWLKDHTTKRWGYLSSTLPLWSKHRACLSGTPVPNKLWDLWAQYYLLDKGKRLMGNYYAFRNTYYVQDKDRYTWSLLPDSEQNIRDRISDLTLRVDAQTDTGLPPINEIDFRIPLPSGVRKIYDDLEENFFLTFAEGDVASRSQAVNSLKLRQLLQGSLYLQQDIMSKTDGKYKTFHTTKFEYAKEIWEQSYQQPTIFVVSFKFEYEHMCKVWGEKLPLIAGISTTTEKQQYIDLWNAGKLSALVVNAQSVAYGLNLQYGGSRIMWLALPWSLTTYLQMNSRLSRPGQTAKSVTVGRVLFVDTVDIVVAQSLINKRDVQQSLLDYMKNKRR